MVGGGGGEEEEGEGESSSSKGKINGLFQEDTSKNKKNYVCSYMYVVLITCGDQCKSSWNGHMIPAVIM